MTLTERLKAAEAALAKAEANEAFWRNERWAQFGIVKVLQELVAEEQAPPRQEAKEP